MHLLPPEYSEPETKLSLECSVQTGASALLQGGLQWVEDCSEEVLAPSGLADLSLVKHDFWFRSMLTLHGPLFSL